MNSNSLVSKDTLKTFDNFKNKLKSVSSNVFCYVKVYIFWKFIQYIIQWDKAQMLKKFTLDKINSTKNAFFSFMSSSSSQFYF